MGWIEPLAVGNAMSTSVLVFGSGVTLWVSVLALFGVASAAVSLALPRLRQSRVPTRRLRLVEVS